jgi:outer membrane protein assembly factor BamB
VNSSPAVAAGVVFVGSDNDNLYALDATTGHERWRFATEGYQISSPAAANGVVYVGSSDGNVYALDAASGSELWRFTSVA